MHRIKVTGYITIEDHEYDDGPLGPLSEEAATEWTHALASMDDLEFEDVTE